jgi:hypothetical protein
MFYIGTITVAAGAVKTNGNTAVPFDLPKGAKRLFIAAPLLDLINVALVRTEAPTLTADNTFPLVGDMTNDNALTLEIPLPSVDEDLYLGVFNGTGASVNIKVFAGF